MSTPELISYLEECDRRGVYEQHAVSALLGAGWKLADIQEGLKVINGRRAHGRGNMHIFASFLGLGIALVGSTMILTQHPMQSVGPQMANLVAAFTASSATEVETPVTRTDEVMAVDQVVQLEKIRTALEVYRGMSGSYPQTLQELEESVPQIMERAKAAGTLTLKDYDLQYFQGLYADRPLIESGLIDQFTGKPFLYESYGTNYSLNYMMRWDELSSNAPSFSMRYKKGWNTASAQVWSEEVAATLP